MNAVVPVALSDDLLTKDRGDLDVEQRFVDSENERLARRVHLRARIDRLPSKLVSPSTKLVVGAYLLPRIEECGTEKHKVYLPKIAEELGIGKEAVSAAIRELHDLGVLIREEVRDPVTRHRRLLISFLTTSLEPETWTRERERNHGGRRTCPHHPGAGTFTRVATETIVVKQTKSRTQTCCSTCGDILHEESKKQVEIVSKDLDVACSENLNESSTYRQDASMVNTGGGGEDITPVTPPVFNQEAIPAELRAHDQWVNWQPMLRDGRRTKVPVDPHTGHAARVNEPGTWGSFADVVAHPEHGIGFMFTATDSFVGIDIDDCRNPDTGEITAEAQATIRALDSYTEISPSGTGIHVLVRGNLPVGCRKRVGTVEIYDRDRYFTITGHHLNGTPTTIEDRTTPLQSLCNQVFMVDQPKPTSTRQNSVSRITASGLSRSDRDLLEKGRQARHGDTFDRLWRGDVSGYDHDHSRADMALCGQLAYLTNGDVDRMDHLFRCSGLYRDKWDERRGEQTYGERTIEQALGGMTMA